MISDIISQLSSRLELLDVAVEAQPIEEIIVQLYKEYRI
jgi:ABC-2 type transport system ATP-binding protein